jgi:aryl-alcohol dehydrogenase-like predicted oxidoreductase
MQKLPFGRTGLDVTPLGFGGAPIGINKTDQQRAAQILNLLLDSGVNLIDTAANYHGSEEMIGESVSNRRDQFILVSKCGSKQPEIDAPAWSPETIARTIDRSLQRLRTDRIDVMLLHTCDLETLKKGEALRALLDARDAGKIRHAGYSGDNETAAYAATLDGIEVIQTSISICDQINIDLVLPECRKRNLGVMAKRPIANAAWKRPEDQTGEFYKGYASTYTERFQKMSLDPKSLGFDGPPDQVWPEIALRFTISQPGVHVAIAGTTSPENTRKNIEFARKGPLPEPAVAAIRKAFRDADPKGSWRGMG